MSFYPAKGGGKAKLNVTTVPFSGATTNDSGGKSHLDVSVAGLGANYALGKTAFVELTQSGSSTSATTAISYSVPQIGVLRTSFSVRDVIKTMVGNVYLIDIK